MTEKRRLLKREFDVHARENQQANQLADELVSVTSAKKLGDAAYETAKQDRKTRKLKSV